MKFDLIKKAAIEIEDLLISKRIERIYQLDDYTFIFALYNKGKNLNLLISILKRSSRFHLLFGNIQKEYYITTSYIYDILKKYIFKGIITKLKLYENCIEITVLSGSFYRLVIDYLNNNIFLLCQDGKSIYSLHRKSELFLKNSVCSFCNDDKRDSLISGLDLNKKLSLDFIKERSDVFKNSLLKIIKTEKKIKNRLIDKVLSDRNEIEKKDEFKIMGELLKYNLNKIKKGVNEIELHDFNGNYVFIKLNPRLSPLENMNFYFTRYKKLKKKEKVIYKKLDFEKRKLELLNKLEIEIKEKETFYPFEPIEEIFNDYDLSLFSKRFKENISTLTHRKLIKRDVVKRRETKDFLKFVSQTGKIIFVGRSSKENDELSIKISRGNDLWFHVEHGKGSHVILRYDKKTEFSDKDIVDASNLALYFSKYRDDKKWNVVYTYCKYLRKPKKSKEGYVIYYNNKTRYTILDNKVLDRLLERTPYPF